MAKRLALCAVALGFSACHSSKASGPLHPAPSRADAEDAIAALRADMVLAVERDAPAAQNECTSTSAVLSAARGSGNVARRLRERLRAQVAPALVSGKSACMVGATARLVPLLPDGDKRAVIGDIARLYERGLDGWALYNEVLPAIAPHLTADEGRRFAAAVSKTKGPSCFRAKVLAHLADVGRVPPSDAFAAMKESRDEHCLEWDELVVLRFADPATLRGLYPREMALLDEPPASFALEHVRALALLAPYIEPKRRRALLVAGFRAMPTAYVSKPGEGDPWGELAPEFHFWFAMLRLAPLVDAGLVDAAVAAVPPAWSAESRGYAVAQIAEELPAPLRHARGRDLLAAIPGPRGGVPASAARLELAAELPPEDVREALDVVITEPTLPSERAYIIARVLRALPAPSLPAYAARVRTDVAAGLTIDVRISTAARVIDALDGIKR